MIPTFNPNPRLLMQTVESVRGGLASEGSEIVIVDDDSSDEAGRAALRELSELGIRVHKNRSRAGLAGNLNRCIELACGELIHILHQDDKVLPDFYRRIEAAFDGRPGLGAAATEVQFIDEDGVVKRSGHCTQKTVGLLEHWIENVVVNLAIQSVAIVVHRETYQELGGFRSDMEYALDWEMWARIACSYPIWFEPTPLAQRREHAGSESARLRRRLVPWTERRACARDLTRVLPRSVAGIALRSARGHLVRLARRELREALSAGDWLGAAVIGLGALWVAPVETLLQQWEATAPPSLPSRAPARASRVGSRRPRIILISEFLPTSEAWGTIGVFQRWSCNIETLLEIGEVDSVFLLREDHSPEDEARLRRVWPTLRYVRMLRVPGRLRYLQILPTVSRALCGSVSCTNGWPDPRIAAPSVATGIAAALRELQPDLVFAHRLGGCATLAALRTPIPPIVTDFDDIEHLKYQRFAQARGRYGPRQRLAAALVRHAERLALRRSRLSLACSEADARRLSELSPGSYIEVLENTAQPGSESPLPQMPRAMFIGVAHYPPNARAVAWLCRDIWPHVRVTMPDAQLVIVGLGTVELGVADPALGIETCGYVHDLEAVYRSSRVALCPVQEGSGTRIKLIEAALRGRPAVSTTVGAEGLAFRPGREILIADRTADFAAACIELLQPGNGRAEDVGRAAWRRACKTYDRDRRRRKLFQLVMQGLRPDVGVDAPETPRPGS